MNTKKYIQNKQDLINEAESILKASDNNEEYLSRVRAVLDVLNGGSKANIAKRAGCSVKTLENWVNWADDDKKGLQSLRFENNVGRKPKLNENQETEIYRIISETYPFEYGEFCTIHWSGTILSKVVSDKMGIGISPRKCRDYLHSCGYNRPFNHPDAVFWRSLRKTDIETTRQLLALYRDGKTVAEIRDKLNVAIRSLQEEVARTEEPSDVDSYEDDYDDY